MKFSGDNVASVAINEVLAQLTQWDSANQTT